MKQQRCIIVGVGRSGTSLLQSMLHSHSAIHFLPETRLLRLFVLPDPHVPISPATKKTLATYDPLQRLPAEKLSQLYHMLNSEATDSLWQLYTSLDEEVEVMGDKDPKLLTHIGELLKLDPYLKIIHIYRDPRDIILSKSKASWANNRSIYLHALIGEVQLKIGNQQIKQSSQSRVLEVKYEDLISHSGGSLKRIVQFLGLDFDQKMLHFQSAASDLIDKSELHWKKETTGPLLVSNYGKWHKGLSKWQIFWSEIISKTYFTHYGYTSSSNLNWIRVGRVLSHPLLWITTLVYKLKG